MLSAQWTFAPALLTQAEARDLAQGWFAALSALVRHGEQPGAGGRTPSDLPLVALSQAEIERLERGYPQIEDVLPLAPLQEGLLFHAHYDAQAADVYTVQLQLGLEGPLDGAALKRAAQVLIDRHASLRAAFRHEDLTQPVQVIVPHVSVPWREVDLSLLDEEQCAARLAELVTRDRAERFDPASPPLLRFTLVRLAAQKHRLVLTSHHILTDGWSTPILVQELLTLYARHGDAASLPRVTPVRDYLAWLARQDRAAAREAWRDTLAGLEEPTRLAPQERKQAQTAPEQIAVSLSAELTAALQRRARRQGFTLNSALQAAWALLLGKLTGRDDVVFGVTVAGRPPEVAGIERMVGLFINTLPLRVELPPAMPLRDLLQDVQDRQSRLLAHPHIGLAEIQQVAGLGELFDTLVVFENYPVDRAGLAAEAGGLRLAEIAGVDATHYPLSLAAHPGERLSLRLSYRGDLFARAEVETLAERLLRLLQAVAAGDHSLPIGRLDLLSAEERRTILHAWNDTAQAIPSITLPELFAAQVQKAPDAVAVIF